MKEPNLCGFRVVATVDKGYQICLTKPKIKRLSIGRLIQISMNTPCVKSLKVQARFRRRPLDWVDYLTIENPNRIAEMADST